MRNVADPRRVIVAMKLTRAERERVGRAARNEGVCLSAWLRRRAGLGATDSRPRATRESQPAAHRSAP